MITDMELAAISAKEAKKKRTANEKKKLLYYLKRHFTEEHWKEIFEGSTLSFNVDKRSFHLLKFIEVLDVPIRISMEGEIHGSIRVQVESDYNTSSFSKRREFYIYNSTRRDISRNYELLVEEVGKAVANASNVIIRR